MKQPVKNPPLAKSTETGEIEASAPSLEISQESSLVVGNDAGMPTLNPPANASANDIDGAFGAGVWNNSKKVSALFSTNENRNSWMHVVDTGWVKLHSSIDSANEALSILATAAKVKASPINYYVDGGQVTQIYVW